MVQMPANAKRPYACHDKKTNRSKKLILLNLPVILKKKVIGAEEDWLLKEIDYKMALLYLF